MHRTYEYRCLPMKGQVKDLDEFLWRCRTLYNAALQERIECYQKTGRSLSLYDQQKSLTVIRSDDGHPSDDGDWSALSVPVGRGPLRTLDLAFKGFFRRLKAGQKPGFPRFKGRGRIRSLHLDTCYGLNPGSGQWVWLTFKGLRGRLRVWVHRPIPLTGKRKAARLVKDPKGWKVQFQVEFPDVEPVTPKGVLGIDVGLAHFLTTDTGEAVVNPRYLQRRLKELRVAQRSLARKKRGSNNRHRQRQVVARLHAKVRNTRRDFHFKTAAALVAQGKTLTVEDLNIKGLARGTFSRQVSDVAWGDFIEKLTHKAESAGLSVVKVDPKGTSQGCSRCGQEVHKDLSVRVHSCPGCGLVMDRDQNAAVNIRNRAGIGPLSRKPGNGLVGSQVLTPVMESSI